MSSIVVKQNYPTQVFYIPRYEADKVNKSISAMIKEACPDVRLPSSKGKYRTRKKPSSRDA